MATVLLVEDEDHVRVLAESYLEEQGHSILAVARPDGALAVLQSDQPVDVLFTDLNLREKVEGGLDLAQRAVELRPGLKVLYTTGWPVTNGTRARFVTGSAFLPKPYTVEQLLTALSVHFRISPQPRRTEF